MPIELPEIQPVRPPFMLRGGHVLAMFLGFFIVVFAVNGVMMTLALRTMPGADVKSAYEASQKFNASTAAAREIARLGYSGHARVGLDGAEIDMAGPDGKPAGGLVLALHLTHPADLSRDTDLAMIETGPGHYVSRAPLPPGSWHLAIEAQQGERTVFRSENRLTIAGAQ